MADAPAPGPAPTEEAGDSGPEMNLKFKLLNGKVFPVKAGSKLSVAKLKIICQGATEIDHDLQRLIYKGRVLKDEQTVDELKINDGDTIIVVKSKKKKKKPNGASPAEAEAA